MHRRGLQPVALHQISSVLEEPTHYVAFLAIAVSGRDPVSAIFFRTLKHLGQTCMQHTVLQVRVLEVFVGAQVLDAAPGGKICRLAPVLNLGPTLWVPVHERHCSPSEESVQHVTCH